MKKNRKYLDLIALLGLNNNLAHRLAALHETERCLDLGNRKRVDRGNVLHAPAENKTRDFRQNFPRQLRLLGLQKQQVNCCKSDVVGELGHFYPGVDDQVFLPDLDESAKGGQAVERSFELFSSQGIQDHVNTVTGSLMLDGCLKRRIPGIENVILGYIVRVH